MLRSRPVVPSRGDIALACVVTVLGQVDVVAPGLFSTHLSGPRWSVAVLYAVSGLSLAWRRTYPFTVFAVVFGGLALEAVLYGASEGNGALVPALVAAYSVAAHGSRRSAYAALVLIPLVMAVRETHNPSNTDWPQTRAALAWDLTVLLAWLTGAWLRARRLYEGELLERAAQAEREREQSAKAAIAEERARMARELHDSIAHSLTVMVVQAEAAEDALDHDPAAARTPLQHVQDTGRDALTEMRQVIGALRGSDEVTGTPAIESLVASAEAAGLAPRLSVTGCADGTGAATRQAAYRVVQEALTNVLKHSRSRHVVIGLDYCESRVEIDVRDDGPPTRVGPQHPGTGHGLVGMRERVSLLGGRLDAGPLPDGGFRVHAVIPTDAGPA